MTRGWHRESHRHSLSARGIKSAKNFMHKEVQLIPEFVDKDRLMISVQYRRYITSILEDLYGKIPLRYSFLVQDALKEGDIDKAEILMINSERRIRDD